MNDTKQLTTQEPQELMPVRGEAETLISQAINKGVDVLTMEKLLAMRRELKAEKAKEEYDQAMAAFQAECPTIQKTKAVKTKSGATAYRYAPIESIVEQVKEPLSRHGFSYSTNMELLGNEVKVAVKVTHAAGHSEVTSMTVPLGNKTDIMSQTQVVAAAQTFAKRYAFCNAFGILTGDEDNDAAPAKEAQANASQRRENIVGMAPRATDKQVWKILKLVQEKGKDRNWINACVAKYGVKQVEDLSVTQASEVIEGIQKMPDPIVNVNDIPENLGA